MNIHATADHKLSTLFAAVILLLAQFISSSHEHEYNHTSLDTNDCVICLLGHSGTDALPFTHVNFDSELTNNYLVTTSKDAVTASFLSAYKTRAPPRLS